MRKEDRVRLIDEPHREGTVVAIRYGNVYIDFDNGPEHVEVVSLDAVELAES